MANTDVLGPDVLVDTTGNNHAMRLQKCNDTGRVGNVNGGQAVCRHARRVSRHGGQLQAVDQAVFEPVAHFAMQIPSLGQPLVEDLSQGHVETVDQLHGRGSEVRTFTSLVVLHDRGPSSQRREVTVHLAVLAVVEGVVHEPAATQRDREACWSANGLLGRGQGEVHPPVVELELLAANGAHRIDHEERFWRGVLDELRDGFQIGQHRRRGVNVCDRDSAVLLVCQLLSDQFLRNRLAYIGGAHNVHLGTVAAQAVSKPVGKRPSGHDQHVPVGGSREQEVRGKQVPAQRAGAGKHKGLRLGGSSGVEDGPGVLQDSLENGNELRGGVAQRGHVQSLLDRLTKDDGAWDQQRVYRVSHVFFVFWGSMEMAEVRVLLRPTDAII